MNCSWDLPWGTHAVRPNIMGMASKLIGQACFSVGPQIGRCLADGSRVQTDSIVPYRPNKIGSYSEREIGYT